MKWISRNLLPILFAISLTSFSATFLYVLLKKNDDDNDNDDSAQKSSEKKSVCVLIKVPKHIVPTIISKNDSITQIIEDKTNSRIRIVDEDAKDTNYTCIIESNDVKNIYSAQSIIKDIIEDRPIIDIHESYIAGEIWDRIVAKDSLIIHKLQRSSGTKIMFTRLFRNDKTEIGNDKRKVTIIGNINQIASAFNEILSLLKKEEDQIQFDNNLKHSKILSSQSNLMKVYVSAMETPSLFWIQIIDNGNNALNTLTSEMTEYYNIKENRELHTLKKIKANQMVAAKFTNGKWYRGKISYVENTKCGVHFVDYGYLEFIAINDILELRTDMLSLQLQAIKCALANVKPIESEWSSQACEKFAELVSLTRKMSDKILIAKVRGYNNRTITNSCEDSCEDLVIPCIDLYDYSSDSNINIGKCLIHDGLAKFETENSV